MKKQSLNLKDALKFILIEEHDKPVVSFQELVFYTYKLYRDKEFNGFLIRKISRDEPERRIIENNIDELISQGVITQHLGLPIYFITSHKKPTAQQYVCTINPLCYISYLSAMEWHGITDRIPNTIHLTTCSNYKYKELISSGIKITFPKIKDMSLLSPQRIITLPNFDNKFFEFHQSRDFQLPKEQFNTGGVRVSSLGDTFVDMLKKPELCGGFSHVVDIFKEYGDQYLPVIVKAVNKNGNAMDKARAGYILEEICHLEHRIINTWKKDVKRGGSRKLIPSNEYSSIYSETWCISINT